ncbi:tRNA epoxyqueuosine(34) reductase QueG [Rhodospirillum rubrum]|uniref:tRNA epoxyqueuosine(34) reductase QueG n=1 Tax=Rhodospirillum rubrum TaxID=1085 RepID=UPI0019079652|nr:tRNA epoxyqueuosine(34) reductase QueG [Rhodospirillum rubrum]MBK1665660.1 tRNA epoxyqueuosine(34) reductase QueG [Rhodospirillum rubrum]MBK1677747.1 tRNA epoxyqueuosine(34) reductase QueG [Rhodospirillum rubrum]
MAKAKPTPAEIKDAIRAKAIELGFSACAFARAELPDSVRANLNAFLDAGHHGSMAWLSETAERRGDPKVLWPSAVSVIALAVNYASGGDPKALAAQADRGVISVYAHNRDYHDVAKGRAKMLGQWMAARLGGAIKVFVDTAPVMEKPLAHAAGLGWQGKHTNLVSRAHGSWLFLAEVFSTLDLPADEAEADHCGRCRRCLDICPTAALPAPYRIDARRCISYLTIEHAGPIPRDLRPLMGNHIYGCDECLAICPWNRFALPTREQAFYPRVELTAPRLADLAGLDDATFRGIFSGSPIKRIGRDRFVRNVLIALGNSADGALLPAVAARLDDPSPLVRGAGAWAFRRLAGAEDQRREKNRRLAIEDDPQVRAEWD